MASPIVLLSCKTGISWHFFVYFRIVVTKAQQNRDCTKKQKSAKKKSIKMSQESFIEQTRASYRVWWAQRSWKASIRGNACYHPESSMYPSWNWTKYEIKWEVEIPRNINSKSQFYVYVRSWQMLKRRIKVNRGTFQANNINYILLEILKNSTIIIHHQ